MYMDSKELWFMNSRIRRFFQRYCEVRVFRKFLEKNYVDLTGKVVLDAGCGSGYSTELIARRFHPEELIAFDIMPQQVERARQRGLSANVFVADVTDTGLPSARFDAVFVFGILHHVPEWRRGLEEIQRLLKPGGILLIEEPDRKALDDAERYLRIRHPRDARFEWPVLVKALEESGFRLVESRKIYLGHFKSFMCVKTAGN